MAGIPAGSGPSTPPGLSRASGRGRWWRGFSFSSVELDFHRADGTKVGDDVVASLRHIDHRGHAGGYVVAALQALTGGSQAARQPLHRVQRTAENIRAA